MLVVSARGVGGWVATSTGIDADGGPYGGCITDGPDLAHPCVAHCTGRCADSRRGVRGVLREAGQRGVWLTVLSAYVYSKVLMQPSTSRYLLASRCLLAHTSFT